MKCDAFVILPNHIHAILRIEYDKNRNAKESNVIDETVGTHGRASLQSVLSINSNEPSTKKYGVAYRPPKSISSFVAGFKSAATTKINQSRLTPKKKVWQKGFHDHTIRADKDYNKIRKYIKNNPINWNDDKFYDG